MATAYVDDVVTALQAAFEPAADPERAVAQARYLKGHFAFLGLDTPTRHALQKPTLTPRPPTAAALTDAALALWALPEREYQYAGSDLLRRHQRLLEPPSLDALATLVTTKSWWDTVDALAAHPVGGLVRRHRELAAVMDDWIGSDDLWLARTALLHQLRWRDETDADRLFRYCERRAADREFFLRKAIGWALRTYAHTDPDAVRAFVAAHDDELSPLSKREALKHLGGWPPA